MKEEVARRRLFATALKFSGVPVDQPDGRTLAQMEDDTFRMLCAAAAWVKELTPEERREHVARAVDAEDAKAILSQRLQAAGWAK